MAGQMKKDSTLLDPHDRLKVLVNYSTDVEVDPKVPTKRYYRSGVEMLKMAQVYYEEGSLENAYVLYMKYMTLFLEKIRSHPDYQCVSIDERNKNHAKIRELMPKTENIKATLLKQYTLEYKNYMEQKKREKEEEEKKKQEPEKGATGPVPCAPEPSWAVVQPPPNINLISYPPLPCTPSIELPTYIAESPEPDKSSQQIADKPSVDRSTKPSSETSVIALKSGLRNVVIPADVMTQFLYLAYKNTMKNIETCGILAGKLEHNELIITHVIVPKQKGTSDTCTTLNEEEIFDFQDQFNLITIGWIHTHPTQTAFLSSVDLHTHCPYQILMPEAVAIVCAPRYNESQVFVLTPGHGLKFIASCQKTGFHPHPTEPPLFMQAQHVKIVKNAPVEVLDLRT